MERHGRGLHGHRALLHALLHALLCALLGGVKLLRLCRRGIGGASGDDLVRLCASEVWGEGE